MSSEPITHTVLCTVRSEGLLRFLVSEKESVMKVEPESGQGGHASLKNVIKISKIIEYKVAS